MPNKFEKRLDVVWQHGHVIGVAKDETPYRYVPRSFNDGGTGWGVWDKKLGRFLKDAELMRVPVEDLRDMLVTN